MDPVQLRIEAEVTQALAEIGKLRAEWIKSTEQGIRYAGSISEVSRVLNNLSGDAAIRAATQYVKAIEQIGGVSRLTEHEQQRVNKVLTEAAEKYRALGLVVPAEMQKIIQATALAGRKIQDNLASSFSGTKIATDATKIVTAIEKIGGVSRLTETELKKVSKVLEEAALKSHKMGEEVPRNIRKVLDEVRKLSGGAGGKGALNIFDGTKITREANQYVEAVRKVGGVARLTIAEQAALNKMLTEAANKYRALGIAVPQSIQRIIDATAHSTRVTTTAGGAWAKFGLQVAAGVIAGQTAVTLASTIIRRGLQNIEAAIEGVVKGIVYLIQRGSEVHRIGGAFQLLADSVKDSNGVLQNFQNSLAAGRSGVKGLINDFDLMQAANRAILLGLPLTADNFKTLTGAALQLGRAMGLEAPRALSDLVLALGRSSPRILDNLGIIVKLRDATREYAEELSKQRGKKITALDLTAEERTIAFYTKAVKTIQQRLEELGPVVLTLSEKFDIVKVSLQNFRDRLALAVELSPVLGKAMDEIGAAILRNMGKDPETAIRHMVDVINGMAIATVKTAAVIVTSVGQMATVIANWAAKTEENKLTALQGLRDILEITRLTAKALSYLPGGDLIFANVEKSTAIAVAAINKLRTSGELARSALASTAKVVGDAATASGKFLTDLVPKLEAVRGQFVSRLAIQQAIIRTNNEEGESTVKMTEKEIKALAKKKKAWKDLMDDMRGIESGQDPTALLSVLNNPFMQLKRQMNVEELIAFQGLTEKQFKKRAQDYKKVLAIELKNAPIEPILQAGSMGPLKDWMAYEAKVGHYSKITETFDKALKGAARSFAQLAQIMGNSDRPLSRVVQRVGELISLMEIGVQAGKSFRTGWDQMNKSVDKGAVSWKNLAGGIGMMALQIPQIIAAMDQATQGATKMSRVLGGAATGAAIGGSIVPGYGHVIGAIAGAIWGALRKIKWREEMKNIAQEWGITINEELAKAIESDAKTRFGGDFIASRLFHLGDIIAQGGGIKRSNITAMTEQLHNIFSQIDTGKLTVDEARESFEKAFPMFVDYLEREGEVASDAIHRIIDLQKEHGLQSKAVLDFIKGQLDTFGSAMTNILGASTKDFEKGFDETFKRAAELKKKIDEITKKAPGGDVSLLPPGLKKELAKLTAEWDIQNGKIQKSTQTVKDWGIMVDGVFRGALEEGLSYREAFDKLGPSLQALIPLYDALKAKGVQFNDALFESLIAEQKLVDKFPELVAAADSFDELFRSMQNLRGLTAETFQASERQMLDVVNRMREAGFSNESILRRIAPALDEIVRLQKEGKIVVNETTADLIAQAGASDLLGKSTKSAAETMKDGFDSVAIGLAAVIEALGGKVPEALQKIVDAANDAKAATDNVGDAAEQLPEQFRHAEDAARRSMDRISSAADSAYDRIDRLNFGASPGGIKEIPIQLAKAMNAAQEFERIALNSFGRVKTEVDGLSHFTIPSDFPSIGSISRMPRPRSRDELLQQPTRPPEVDNVPRDDKRPIQITIADGAIRQKIDTWTLGAQRDMIKNQVGPELLRQIGEGGDLYSGLLHIVTEIVQNREAHQ